MHGLIKDLTGQRFGKLTVVKYSHSGKGGSYWICKCDCGKECVALAHSLKTRHKTSCGCVPFSMNGLSKDRLYGVWRDMLRRCNNPKFKSYCNYGGRGISVCPEWMSSFSVFREWALLNGYEEGLTIERIDNDGNYSPDNCKWATYKEQLNNTRFNHTITYNGETHTIAQWSEIIGISYATMRSRIKRNWSMDRIISTPQQKRSLK